MSIGDITGVKIMRILKDGEVGSKSTTVDGDIVTCVHQSVHPSIDKSCNYQLTWLLDFSNMTKEQIMQAAAEHFVIKIRREFKKVDKPDNDDWNNVSFDCSQYITSRTTKQERIAKELASLSDEQRAELLKLLETDS